MLDRAFPFFWSTDPTSEEIQRQTQAFVEQGVDYIFQDLGPPRRFAGGWSLPRSRYFTLCVDEIGDDQFTLAHELGAYLDPLRAGLTLFADMSFPAALEEFKKFVPSAELGSYILVLLLGRPGAISPVIDFLDQQGLIPHEHNTQWQRRCLIAVQIPYRIERREIANVLDLRLLECQQYIVEEFFKKDTDQLRKKDRSGINSFAESLPILMDPNLGGGPMAEGTGGILRALASFVRSQGAAALVFPSARSDVLAVSRFGTLDRWRGWCLVDYTGTATDPLTGIAIDWSAGWPKAFPKGAEIRHATDGEYAGSFEVQGIVKWSREMINDKEAAFLRAQEPQ